MGITSFILGILCFFATFLLIDSSLKILLIVLLLISFIFGLISTCTGKVRGLGITGLVFSIISIIIILASMGTNNNKSTNNINTVSPDILVDKENSTTETIEQQNTEPISRETYDKIQTGMTEQEIHHMLGDPMSISETNTPGVGTMVLKHYQTISLLDTKAIDVWFLNGKVYMKNWIDL